MNRVDVHYMNQADFIALINSLTHKELDYIFSKFGYDYEKFYNEKLNRFRRENTNRTVFDDKIKMLSYWYLVYEQHKNSKIVDLVIEDAVNKYRGFDNENK